MTAYILAFAVFAAYIYFTALAAGKGFSEYITENKRLMIFGSIALVVLTFFRAVVGPYLMAPVAISIATAYLTGSLLSKIIGLWDAFKKWVSNLVD